MSTIAAQWGGIDILVNNAGVNTAKHRVNIDEFPREEWDRIVGIDLTGTYLVTQAVTRMMIPQGEGGLSTSPRCSAWFRPGSNAPSLRPRLASSN